MRKRNRVGEIVQGSCGADDQEPDDSGSACDSELTDSLVSPAGPGGESLPAFAEETEASFAEVVSVEGVVAAAAARGSAAWDSDAAGAIAAAGDATLDASGTSTGAAAAGVLSAEANAVRRPAKDETSKSTRSRAALPSASSSGL